MLRALILLILVFCLSATVVQAGDFTLTSPTIGSGTILTEETVHALKIEKIDVPYDSSVALIGFMINANALGKASFTALYGRVHWWTRLTVQPLAV